MNLLGRTQTPFDAVRFCTSWLISPALLFILRAVISLYIFVAIYVILGEDSAQGASSARHEFSYFTSLTYWGLAFYFAFAAMHTAIYWRSGNPFLAKWPKALQIAHSVFYSTIVVFPCLVTIVYWSLIYSHFNSRYDVWSNVSQHALNSVFALFEITIPRTDPLPFLHAVAIVVILGLYLGVAYITYDDDHFYVYDFLNIQEHGNGIVAGYIIGILVGAIVLFLIVRYLILLRKWITESKMGKAGKFSTSRPQDGHLQLGDLQMKHPAVTQEHV